MTKDPSWTGSDPAEITAWTLVQAGHVIGRRFHAAFAEVGLTPTQFGVLLELDLHPGMTNGQLARSVLVTPQSTSELMASLQKLGLVHRDTPVGRGHPVPAQLTPAGRAVLARCTTAVADVQASLHLTGDQLSQLNELLRRVLDSETTDRPACR